MSESDLEDNHEQILKNLRKKAHGILLNFVSAKDFDFQTPIPKCKNGMYKESVQRVSGSLENSICEKIQVKAIVFNPDEKKIERLLNERISILSINAITFGISVPVNEQETLLDIGTKVLQKLQEDYIILSYDNTEGAKIEICKDFFLSFMPSKSVLKVRLSTKYNFQLEQRMQNFSIIEFMKNLMNY